MQGVLIPFYWAYPTDPPPNLGTASLIALQQKYPNARVICILGRYGQNNYVAGTLPVYDASWNTAVNQLQAGGVTVLAYMFSNSWGITLAEAKGVVDNIISLYPQLDGIFIDEYGAQGDNPAPEDEIWPVESYTELNAYIRSKGNYFIVGNSNNSQPHSTYEVTDSTGPDLYLVSESQVNAPDAAWFNSLTIPKAKRAAIIYDAPSASTTDVAIQTLFTAVDYIYFDPYNHLQIIDQTYIDRQLSFAELSKLYVTFSSQPSLQTLNSNGGIVAYSTNELMLADGSQFQLKQSELSSSQLKFISSISESQNKQTSLANALELFQSAVAQSQNKNAEAVLSALTFSGLTSEAQNKNAEASLASLNFAGSVSESQLAQQESSSLALFFSGTIAELQALQAEALTGTITAQGVFVGSVNQLQTLQAESVLSAESFEAFISEVQLSQSEAVAVIQAFQGVAQSQKVQEEAGTGQLLFVGIVSQSQRLQSEFALDITPVIVKNASTVYASQIESAKRQIKAKGASVVWRSPQITADEIKPWKVAGFTNVEHTVSIVFDIVTGSNKSSRYLKDTNIEIGTEIGYMASVDFEPNLGDVVIRKGKELSVKNINTIQPDGNPILHIIEFAK